MHYSQCNTIIFVALYTTFVSTLRLQHNLMHYTQHLCNSFLCNTIIFIAQYTTFVSTLRLQHNLLHYTQNLCNSSLCKTIIFVALYTTFMSTLCCNTFCCTINNIVEVCSLQHRYICCILHRIMRTLFYATLQY